ncbi:serine protease 38 [Talpa occidentalis]|uniref:serine protease 38 n=1 Tax=Talpa occidentalis TaxID=50954 RepID=UPI00188FB8AA|nr:serine protease 38 [Talpa occidentalis]
MAARAPPRSRTPAAAPQADASREAGPARARLSRRRARGPGSSEPHDRPCPPPKARPAGRGRCSPASRPCVLRAPPARPGGPSPPLHVARPHVRTSARPHVAPRMPAPLPSRVTGLTDVARSDVTCLRPPSPRWPGPARLMGAAPARAPLMLLLLLPPPAACGQRGLPGKVVGGADAPEKRWPWQASVHYLGLHVCGASVIHAYWVLSAAHCFGRHMNIRSLDVYVGLVDLRVAGSHTQWFEVHRVILHPTYEMYHPVGGDIALVQLKSGIVFSDAVRPICLPPPDVNLLNLSCWATGWGLKSQKGETSDRLQEVPLPLISVFLCQQLLGHHSYILPDMLCAWDLGKTRTVCEGDSGGPLVCEFNHSWMQVGVVSWGRGCAYPMYPAVFARVSYFSMWIHRQIARLPLPPQPLPACACAPRATLTILVTMLAIGSVC